MFMHCKLRLNDGFYDFETKSAQIGAFNIMDNPYQRKDKDLFEVDVGEELA